VLHSRGVPFEFSFETSTILRLIELVQQCSPGHVSLCGVLLLPLDIDELKLKIAAAVETINRNMLERVWNELDYRLDICRITNGAHIEQL
jgi:hypothetical protein